MEAAGTRPLSVAELIVDPRQYVNRLDGMVRIDRLGESQNKNIHTVEEPSQAALWAAIPGRYWAYTGDSVD